MPDLIGKTFRRRELQGDIYDVVKIVGLVRQDEIDEPIVAPVEFGETVQISDAQAFSELYTSEGVKQHERVEPPNGGYGWGSVAGEGRPRTEADTPPDYSALLEPEDETENA